MAPVLVDRMMLFALADRIERDCKVRIDRLPGPGYTGNDPETVLRIEPTGTGGLIRVATSPLTEGKMLDDTDKWMYDITFYIRQLPLFGLKDAFANITLTEFTVRSLINMMHSTTFSSTKGN